MKRRKIEAASMRHQLFAHDPKPEQVYGPVYAYRRWALGTQRDGRSAGEDRSPVLMPHVVAHYGNPWSQPVAKMYCDIGHGHPGDKTIHVDALFLKYHKCGLYALKSLGGALMRRINRDEPIGIVELQGRAVEGPLGYRAERAQIMALAASEATIRNVLRQRYGVPVYCTAWWGLRREGQRLRRAARKAQRRAGVLRRTWWWSGRTLASWYWPALLVWNGWSFARIFVETGEWGWYVWFALFATWAATAFARMRSIL